MHLSPRCGAKCKRTGLPCKAPAMLNGRCRMHGGKSPGPPKNNKNSFKNGRFTAKAIAERKQIRSLIKETNRMIDEINVIGNDQICQGSQKRCL
jgi:hypothetical protein